VPVQGRVASSSTARGAILTTTTTATTTTNPPPQRLLFWSQQAPCASHVKTNSCGERIQAPPAKPAPVQGRPWSRSTQPTHMHSHTHQKKPTQNQMCCSTLQRISLSKRCDSCCVRAKTLSVPGHPATRERTRSPTRTGANADLALCAPPVELTQSKSLPTLGTCSHCRSGQQTYNRNIVIIIII
jgi:hypothetical protein